MALIFILVSALATLIVRLLPFYATWLDRLPPFLNRALRLLPIAALGPLIFPGVLLDYGSQWWAGIAGIAVAALLAWKQKGMVLPILLSIFTTWAALSLF